MSVKATKISMITDLMERGFTKMQTYDTLRPMVQDQRKPMVFTFNVPGGRRQPKPLFEQYQELKNAIGRIYSENGRAESAQWESEEIPAETVEPVTVEPVTVEPEPEEIPEHPVAKGKESLENEFAYFNRRVREIRRFCIDKLKGSSDAVLDDIGIRPAEIAAKLLPAGIPADILLLCMTMHWSPASREEAGIDPFDFNVEGKLIPHPGFLKVSQEVMRSRGIDSTDKHMLFGYALLLVENRVPMMLIGPKGTGKSYLAKQVAEYLEMDYSENGMAAGASRGDLLGRHTMAGAARAAALAALAQIGDADAISELRRIAAGEVNDGFVDADFEARYGNGGMHNFEEIDRADPGIVVALNNALAGNELHNSTNGKTTKRSENYCAVCTANTFGMGGNSQYPAAERMDMSVVDRFGMGRIFLPIDETLETNLLYGRI